MRSIIGVRLRANAIRTGAILHGHDLPLQGLTVGQVVHDYGDVCQSITELRCKRTVLHDGGVRWPDG